MNLKLVRKEKRDDGIFSMLYDESGNCIAHTLEHSYDNEPKIPNGTFTCHRGKHLLHGMTSFFETFEISGVAGHSNLLFHWGNFNRDSEGCILLGADFAFNNSEEMITDSKDTFKAFMNLQNGLDEFQLEVV